jgi:MFS family permease
MEPVPIFGKLGDEHGRKPFVIVAILLFTLASMLCGMAQSMLQLVLARALQGIIFLAGARNALVDAIHDSQWFILHS